MDVLILSERHRRVAARIEEDVVVYDYVAARKTVLPPDMADHLARTYDLQEETRREFDSRARHVIRAVEGIEGGM